MIVDHQTCTIPHGRMDEYLEGYAAIGLALQRRYLGHHIGSYVSEIGLLNQVIHLWGFESAADREARYARLRENPEWAAFVAMNTGLLVVAETRLLRAASFSSQLPAIITPP